MEKTFRTGERAIGQLDAADWKIVAPPAGTVQPLEIRFPRPLDRALLQRCLRIAGADGTPIRGTVRIGEGEQSWFFRPERLWREAEHHLLVESVLEDLAGNSLARPFEVDLRAPPPRGVGAVVDLPFQPSHDAR